MNDPKIKSFQKIGLDIYICTFQKAFVIELNFEVNNGGASYTLYPGYDFKKASGTTTLCLDANLRNFWHIVRELLLMHPNKIVGLFSFISKKTLLA